MDDYSDPLMTQVWFAAVLAMAAGAAAPAQSLPGEQKRILEDSRQVALNYSKWLPDLICTELIRRDTDWGATGRWTFVDTLTAQVTYFERKESYKLIAHNQHSANQRFENPAGAISKGEFGSMLRWIFDPEAKADFEWKATETIRRRTTSVFAYRVNASNSRLELAALSNSIFAGFHGLVYIDDETKLVLRLTAETDGPEHFPIRDSFVSIDYDWTEISGHRYLVPVRAETRMTENPPATSLAPAPAPDGIQAPPVPCVSCGSSHGPIFGTLVTGPGKKPLAESETKYRNRIEFRGYRRFTADSTLKFEGDAGGSPAKR